jgi:hypothetical protein
MVGSMRLFFSLRYLLLCYTDSDVARVLAPSAVIVMIKLVSHTVQSPAGVRMVVWVQGGLQHVVHLIMNCGCIENV